MTWQKARCPECGNVYDQWDGRATDGTGGITFDGEFADVGDIMVTSVDMSCPNPECTFTLEDVSTTALEEWFKEHKVGGD